MKNLAKLSVCVILLSASLSPLPQLGPEMLAGSAALAAPAQSSPAPQSQTQIAPTAPEVKPTPKPSAVQTPVVSPTALITPLAPPPSPSLTPPTPFYYRASWWLMVIERIIFLILLCEIYLVIRKAFLAMLKRTSTKQVITGAQSSDQPVPLEQATSGDYQVGKINIPSGAEVEVLITRGKYINGGSISRITLGGTRDMQVTVKGKGFSNVVQTINVFGKHVIRIS